MSLNIRNLAIIAHVDHGKTTLVDQLLQAGGTYRENQAVTERAMDSMDLEREKGITIKAKNTSVHWEGHTINIVDTPGHADFGAEVERVMKMVDGVLLVVDAFGGPQAQTRFVLRKALAEGLKPIVVINKIDRPLADPLKVRDQVLELFLDLDATEDQFNAPFVYGSARDGYFMDHPDDEKKDCIPLLKKIVEFIPEPQADPSAPFSMLVSNIEWDDYVGRVAVGKVLGGSVKKGDTVWLLGKDGSVKRQITSPVSTQTLTVGRPCGRGAGAWGSSMSCSTTPPSGPLSRPKCAEQSCPSQITRRARPMKAQACSAALTASASVRRSWARLGSGFTARVRGAGVDIGSSVRGGVPAWTTAGYGGARVRLEGSAIALLCYRAGA